MSAAAPDDPNDQTVEVWFEPAHAKALVTKGETILVASEVAGVEILTGCTAGMCGTDPVEILAGLDHLSAAEEHEIGTLHRMGLSAAFRLSCSARVLGGPVHVRTDAF